MSGNEEIFGQYVGMMGYQKEEPPTFGMKNGTTIWTNKRIIFLRSRFGETRYDNFEKIEKDLEKKDSFQINLEDIVGIDVEVHSSYLSSYLKVNYKNNSETEYASFLGQLYTAGTLMNIAQAMQKKLQRKIDDPEEIIMTRNRNLIQIDQTHDQIKVMDHQTALLVALNNAATSKGCKDLIILTKRRKEWEKDENLKLSETALLTSFGTKHKKYKRRDIEKIKNYVSSGGVFFLTPEPDNDPPNILAIDLGVKFGKKSIEDKENHSSVFDDHIIIQDFTDHPINKNINRVSFGSYGCYPVFIQTDTGFPLAYSSPVSDPPKSIVAAIIKLGKGLVIVVGQQRIFEDDFLPTNDNFQWLQNMFEYALLFEKLENQIKQEPKTKLSPFCTNCGAKFNPEDKFCGECGQAR